MPPETTTRPTAGPPGVTSIYAWILFAGPAHNHTPRSMRPSSAIHAPGVSGIAARVAALFCRHEMRSGAFFAAIKEPFFGSPAPRAGQALSIILIAAVLVAVGTTVLIILAPEEGEKFTEFYILGPKG
ncbi:DUF1616 domain-containing protein, partial [Methanoculleus bourgensis]|uniref:DUF1616 domain-containing protein n=1 Tax=Methanoculleus bourgensis TaxID=83986 RepID=UPI003B92497D